MEASEHAQSVDGKYVTQVAIGDSFATNKASLAYILSDKDLASGTPSTDILDSLPAYSVGVKRRDTQIGGNDAINCYYQFNENDDIIHDINRVNSTNTGGMGRVYNETFDEQQQIMWISFGVPDFTNAGTFIEKAYDKDLAALMNTGDVSLASKIGTFLGKVTGTVIALPFLPIKWALDLLTSEAAPTKYYDFKPTMPLYFKTVNVILAHIAVNMDLASYEKDGLPNDGTPEILKKHGLDILTILNRKFWYDDLNNTGSATSPSTDDILKKLASDPMYETNWWNDIAEGASLGLTEAFRYVGFRIEKSTNSSESGSSSTKEPEILNTINSQVSAGRARTFNLGAIKETSAGQVANSLYELVSGFISGGAESVGIQGGLEVLKGAGFIDIPEIWNSSSFSKSYSFDFQLRTPYGDPFSIFYSLYIPLAMVMAGAFPRSVGQNSYTSPYLVRAYCKGMFAIPLGIIDSITITRGAAEYGWSNIMLPTQIDISFTIKDLSPIMHLAIADGGYADWANILGQNSTFQEYMLTLSGTNVAERTLKLELMKKRAKALATIVSNNKLNPLMFGLSLTNTYLGRALTAITPKSKLPGKVTNI